MRRRHFVDSALSLSSLSVIWPCGPAGSMAAVDPTSLFWFLFLSPRHTQCLCFFFTHADVIASVSKNCSLIIFPMAASPDRRVNLAVARIIPPILLGIVIYACYAVTKQLCSRSFYLLRDFPENVWLIASLKKIKLTTWFLLFRDMLEVPESVQARPLSSYSTSCWYPWLWRTCDCCTMLFGIRATFHEARQACKTNRIRTNRQIVLVANIIDGKVVGLERKQPRRLIDRTRMSMSKGDWSLMLEGKHILWIRRGWRASTPRTFSSVK